MEGFKSEPLFPTISSALYRISFMNKYYVMKRLSSYIMNSQENEELNQYSQETLVETAIATPNGYLYSGGTLDSAVPHTGLRIICVNRKFMAKGEHNLSGFYAPFFTKELLSPDLNIFPQNLSGIFQMDSDSLITFNEPLIIDNYVYLKNLNPRNEETGEISLILKSNGEILKLQDLE